MWARLASRRPETSGLAAKLVPFHSMSRLFAIGLLAAFGLAACATSTPTKYSYTPKTEVVVKGAKKKDVQANYQVSPEERQGSAGSAGSDR
jgi:PBP1b-binding outer membrane lipoprotein LpoB